MQEKTDLLNPVSAQTVHNINMNNTKIMKANTKSNTVVTVGGKSLGENRLFHIIWAVKSTRQEAQKKALKLESN